MLWEIDSSIYRYLALERRLFWYRITAVNNKFIIRILIFILVPVLSGCGEIREFPSAEKGKIDLSGWNFAKNGPVPLAGRWEFYWARLLSPSDFQRGRPEKTGYLELPGAWKGYSHDGRTLAGEGYATFRLAVDITAGRSPMAFRIRDVGSVCNIWVNGALTASSGTVGTTPKTEIPRRPQLISAPFPGNVNSLEIIVQASNFHWQKVGLRSALLLGEEKRISLDANRDLSVVAFLGGMLLMIGLYHLALYLMRLKDPANLYCCFTCGAWSVFILFGANTGWAATALFPEIPWRVFIDMEFITLVMGAVGMSLVYHEIFPDNRFRFLKPCFLGLGGAFILCALALPPREYYSISLLFYPVVIIIIIYLTIVIALDLLRQEPDIYFLIPGYLAGAFTGGWDSLRELGMVDTPSVHHYGLFAFLLSLSFLISYRSARAHRAVEALGRELEEKNTALVRADRLKDEFLANTSHELRTPLSGIIGLADSLLTGAAGKISQTMKTNLTMISTSGKRLNTLINDILDFSKLKNDAVALHIRPVDLKSLTDIVIAVSARIDRNKPIRIENRIPDDLPLVNGDEDKLQQVLFNLVGNAVKFTHKGTITLNADEEEDRVTISVSDTGVGVPPESRASIFHPFEQADASISRSFQGAGLGLGISRTLIELHKGRLWLETSSDKGSTFCFTLPKSSETNRGRTEADHAIGLDGIDVCRAIGGRMTTGSRAPDMNVGRLKTGEIPTDAPRVLVVDDDPVNLQVALNILSMENMAVTTATGGREAARLVEAEPSFDLVLLDIMMPEISGLDVCQRLREKFSAAELPVLLVTAKNRLADLLEGLACGANDYKGC